MNVVFYPVVVHKELESSYGVSVPDLPGCVSAGDTIEEAFVNAKEAIELHLEGIIEDDQSIPKPSDAQSLIGNGDYADAYGWFFVPVEVNKIVAPTKSVRINLTLPENVLKSIDKYVEKRGKNRSAFIAESALGMMKGFPVEVMYGRRKAWKSKFAPSKPKKASSKSTKRRVKKVK